MCESYSESEILKLEKESSLNTNIITNKPITANELNIKKEIDTDKELFGTNSEAAIRDKNFDTSNKNDDKIKSEGKYLTISIKMETPPEREFVPQQSTSMNQIYIKTETSDIDGEFFEFSKVQNIKEEENLETNFDSTDIDPLKLDDKKTVIKLERGVKAEIEIVPQESISENHSFVKTEIGVDQRTCETIKVKAFTHPNKLRTNEKQYTCDDCGKLFLRAESIKAHKVIHTGEKPYVCDVCSKAFSRASCLHRHKLAHPGAKTLSCDICGKAFHLKDNLRAHKLIHSGERRHVCDVCDKSFNRASGLSRHKLIHSGLKTHMCDICSKFFFHKRDAIIHKRIHTGEKPYVCDVCKKSFNIANNLKSHKLIHSGEKIHSCDVCSKSFLRGPDLKRHKLIHTR